MEDKRASGGGLFGVGVTPITLTATLAVVVLFGVIVWNLTSNAVVASNPIPIAQTVASAQENPTASNAVALDANDLSNFAPQVIGELAAQYAALQENGTYTKETGAAVAAQLAPSLKAPLSYKTFSILDISIVEDVSPARIQRYQADLRAALAPLSKNTTPEIAIFSAYVQTGETKYLDQLRSAAGDYERAARAASKVAVPSDAIAQHIGVLNAMEQFSATLKALADNPEDPITVIALLQTYNDAERDMVVALNTFASYIAAHQKS
ncbi:MAG TPA: hypothetical protein VJG64_03435 [Candidatus Paceibacterota bacterium]